MALAIEEDDGFIMRVATAGLSLSEGFLLVRACAECRVGERRRGVRGRSQHAQAVSGSSRHALIHRRRGYRKAADL